VPGLGHQYPECTGWIRAVKGDFRLVKEVGLKETGMLTSSSDYHIFHKLKFRSHKECMDSYCEVVQAAFDAGVRPAATWRTSRGRISTGSCCPSWTGSWR